MIIIQYLPVPVEQHAVELCQCHANRRSHFHMSIWTVRDQVFLRAQGSTRLLVLKLQFPVIDPSTGQPSKVLRGLVRVRWPHMELAILQCSRNLQEWNCDKKHLVTILTQLYHHDMTCHTPFML